MSSKTYESSEGSGISGQERAGPMRYDAVPSYLLVPPFRRVTRIAINAATIVVQLTLCTMIVQSLKKNDGEMVMQWSAPWSRNVVTFCRAWTWNEKAIRPRHPSPGRPSPIFTTIFGKAKL